MQNLGMVVLLTSVIGLALCIHFRREFNHWNEQPIAMKTILFVIAINTAGAVVGALVVLSSYL